MNRTGARGYWGLPFQGRPARGRRRSCLLWVAVILAVAFAHIPAPLVAAHFQLPFAPTEYGDQYCDYLGRLRIRGMEAQMGDVVAFLNNRGEICGTVAVGVEGQYGAVAVYGHFIADGDTLGVRVWDARQGREWRSGSVLLKPGTPSTFFVAAAVPPTWVKGAGFALDIEVLPLAGDVNADGRINLEDLVLALQVAAGVGPTNITVDGDVNGVGRIGLAEGIYILQHGAGLR